MRWLWQCLLLGLHFRAHLDFPVLTDTPGQAGVLGAEEPHHHQERSAARIMTKSVQSGVGLSSQINPVLHGLEQRESIQAPKQLG